MPTFASVSGLTMLNVHVLCDVCFNRFYQWFHCGSEPGEFPLPGRVDPVDVRVAPDMGTVGGFDGCMSQVGYINSQKVLELLLRNDVSEVLCDVV